MRRANSILAARAGIRQTRTVVHADRVSAELDRLYRALLRATEKLARDHGKNPAVLYGQVTRLWRGYPSAVAFLLRGSMARVGRWARRSALADLRRATPKILREASGFRVDDDGQGVYLPARPSDEWERFVLDPGWEDRFARLTKLAEPELVANAVLRGLQAGKTHQEIGRDLLPLVGGQRATARRVARTEVMRVAQEAQLRMHEEQAGDLIAGYQVRATLDQHTRPHHAARDGTVYWKNPRPGQKSVREMPRPPIEEDGSYAWNCRCTLAPVMSDPNATQDGDDQPDPPAHDHYADWFDDAPDRERLIAVGVRRYRAVEDLIADDPPSVALPNGEHVAIIPPEVKRPGAVTVSADADMLTGLLGPFDLPARERPQDAIPTPILTWAGDRAVLDDTAAIGALIASGAGRVVLSVSRADMGRLRELIDARPVRGKKRPGWEDFLDPGTGKLLSLEALRAESPGQRRSRVDRVREMLKKIRRGG